MNLLIGMQLACKKYRYDKLWPTARTHKNKWNLPAEWLKAFEAQITAEPLTQEELLLFYPPEPKKHRGIPKSGR